jgi:hypothetical protein
MLMALNTLCASLVDGHQIPSGSDSFYHARRILDTVGRHSAFYGSTLVSTFPEGSQATPDSGTTGHEQPIVAERSPSQ